MTGETYDRAGYINESLRKYRSAYLPIHTGDVAEVIRYGTDDNTDTDWYAFAAVVRLTNGKYAAVEGACDYTGFDCQATLDASVHDTAEEAWPNLTRDGRAMIERA